MSITKQASSDLKIKQLNITIKLIIIHWYAKFLNVVKEV